MADGLFERDPLTDISLTRKAKRGAARTHDVAGGGRRFQLLPRDSAAIRTVDDQDRLKLAVDFQLDFGRAVHGVMPFGSGFPAKFLKKKKFTKPKIRRHVNCGEASKGQNSHGC